MATFPDLSHWSWGFYFKLSASQLQKDGWSTSCSKSIQNPYLGTSFLLSNLFWHFLASSFFPPVRWARRDKPQRDHFVGICEVLKRKPSTLKKNVHVQRRSRFRLSPKPIPSPPAGMTIRKVFFVFDAYTQRTRLSLNPSLSKQWNVITLVSGMSLKKMILC